MDYKCWWESFHVYTDLEIRFFSWPWFQNQFIMVLSWSLLLVCKTHLCAFMLNTKTLSLGSLILEGWIQTSRNFFQKLYGVLTTFTCSALLKDQPSEQSNSELDMSLAYLNEFQTLWMKSITCPTLSLSLAVQLD